MKVTVLGANGAFSTGKHDNMISLSDLDKIIKELQEQFCNVDETYEKYVKRAYVPTWQSNFLIEFDMPGRVNKNVFRFVLDFGGDIRHSLENRLVILMHGIVAILTTIISVEWKLWDL